MPERNRMIVNGKDIDNPDASLTINLADDNLEVRGFGQAITRQRAEQMANTYFLNCEAGFKVIEEIESKAEYKALADMEEFKKLKDIIDPKVQTVSGVFGKEILLQMISMRHCEGIRYIIGNDGTQNTVILIGVDEGEGETTVKGIRHATSVPVKLKALEKSGLTVNDNPLDSEVHGNSLTIAGVRAEMARKEFLGPKNDPARLLFGKY